MTSIEFLSILIVSSRTSDQFNHVCLEVTEAIDKAIVSQMQKIGTGVWQCIACGWETKYKTRLYEHVEARHIGSSGHTCPICGKFSSSLKALKMHKLKYHKSDGGYSYTEAIHY